MLILEVCLGSCNISMMERFWKIFNYCYPLAIRVIRFSDIFKWYWTRPLAWNGLIQRTGPHKKFYLRSSTGPHSTAEKKKFSIKDFFSKYDQSRRKLWKIFFVQWWVRFRCYAHLHLFQSLNPVISHFFNYSNLYRVISNT